MSGNFSFAEAKREVFRLKVGSVPRGLGWSPRIRQRFGYFTPDECYEALLLRLIDPMTEWLDVGCGHRLFPSNLPLAELLSKRCRLLVGVDPSENIDLNELVHERARCTLEEYRTPRQFDLISLRMVAEHIAKPADALAAMSRLTRVGGRVVIYTVSKWSPSSLLAAATPLAVHHLVKNVLWGGVQSDTFPTVYRMNSRTELSRMFAAAGFLEEDFFYLNDCRSLGRWRVTMTLELMVERLFGAVGLRYPEVCLLGVYRKHDGKTG